MVGPMVSRMIGWTCPLLAPAPAAGKRMVNAPCKLCQKKRARRHCPGLSGEICPGCCGAERENSIDCPQACEYLQEARLREHSAATPEDNLAHPDIRISEEFLSQHEDLVVWISGALVRSMEAARAVDSDAREALDALIRTYRTRESGLIYETRPANPYAAQVQDALKDSIQELSKAAAEASGMHSLRDADILGVLVFLERVELQHASGRRRGRAFYDFLCRHFPANEPNRVTA
jgi:hypothetical protein